MPKVRDSYNYIIESLPSKALNFMLKYGTVINLNHRFRNIMEQ